MHPGSLWDAWFALKPLWKIQKSTFSGFRGRAGNSPYFPLFTVSAAGQPLGRLHWFVNILVAGGTASVCFVLSVLVLR